MTRREEVSNPLYSRVVVKVSGEFLGGGGTLDAKALSTIGEQLATIQRLGVNAVVVVGGGNFIRGRDAARLGISQSTGDLAGMISTGINALIIKDVCRGYGAACEVVHSQDLSGVRGTLPAAMASELLDVGCLAILAGGSGREGISTDVPAVEIAANVKAEAVLMLKHGAEGVLDRDPRLDDRALLLAEVSATDAIDSGLNVMDMEALVGLRLNGILAHVFSANEPDGIVRVLSGERLGSVVFPR